MDNEPEWAKVLDEIYRENIVWSMDEELNDEHPVVSSVDFDPETVQENLALLSQSGLIGQVQVGIRADVPRPGKEGVIGITENARQHGTHVGLTARGFHVAHERDMRKKEQEEQDRRIQSQNEINSAIGYLTLGLLFINFVDTWVATALNGGISNLSPSVWVALISAAIIIVAYSIILYQTGLLDPDTILGE